ncbi:MAG: DUF885 domain-containing protein [Myxococcota bacterium]|nr:DUF885 domain-containing protein [Myxococcota bacterium]
MKRSNNRLLCFLVLLIWLSAGCSFDEFVDESYAVISERNPEISSMFNATAPQPMRMDNVSDEYLSETYKIEEVILEKLLDFDYQSLTVEQQVTYDVYRDFLVQDLRGQQYRFHDLWYKLEPRFGELTSTYFWLLPVESFDDALRFARDLRQLKTRVKQRLNNYTTAKQRGLIPAGMIIERRMIESLTDCGLYYPGGEFVMYGEMLYYMLDAAGIDLAEEQSAELDAELAASVEHYRPSCEQLIEFFTDTLAEAPVEEGGAWVFPDGQSYYENRLTYFNNTTKTASEIHQLGMDELSRIHQRIRARMASAGYPTQLSIPELTSLLNDDCPRVAADALEETFSGILDEAKSRLSEVTSFVPETELILYYSEGTAAAYGPPRVNSSDPGWFVFGPPFGEEDVSSIMLKSLAYHETYPGHHVQFSIAQELDLPLLRKVNISTAHVEGWALYSERLSMDLGWYGGDVCGEVGQMLGEAFRAARLVVDTGLHALEWTRDEAIAFMYDNLGQHLGTVHIPSEVTRYIMWPGQATAYYIGLLEIMSLRDRAEQTLGDQFDLVEFNDVLLGSGHVNLSILERLVVDYMRQNNRANQ